MILKKRIIIIAGEASGDAHAGRMLVELKKIAPEIKVSGIGGDIMRSAGADIKVNFSELAVMGIVEIFKGYCQIKKTFNELATNLKHYRPDLLVLVDYPEFNLKLAKVAQKIRIPVIYYISPKVWAWRTVRIKKIKCNVDHMAVLFPFEQPFYEVADISVSCVGHPLVDSVKTKVSAVQAKQKFGLKPDRTVIGIFPGSRCSEVGTLLPIMIAAVEKLYNDNVDITVVLPLAPGLNINLIKIMTCRSRIPIQVVTDNFYDLIKSCDAIVAASGTVTLEIALLGVPHILIYRVAPITYHILKRLVKIPYVGLCNIISGELLVSELLQDEVTSQLIY